MISPSRTALERCPDDRAQPRYRYGCDKSVIEDGTRGTEGPRITAEILEYRHHFRAPEQTGKGKSIKIGIGALYT